MELEIGAVVEGKVKSLTKFGAFVVLPDHTTGMVHISEVAYTFVSDIAEHLHEGDTVKVMIIGRENGKTSLSIKRTQPRPQPQGDRPAGTRPPFDGQRRNQNDRFGDQRPERPERFDRQDRPNFDRRRSAPVQQAAQTPAAPQQKSFDDMLKQFMTESDSKMSSLKQYSDRKTKNRRR